MCDPLRRNGGAPAVSPLPAPHLTTVPGERKKLSFLVILISFFSFPPLPLDVSLMPAARRAADSCGT